MGPGGEIVRHKIRLGEDLNGLPNRTQEYFQNSIARIIFALGKPVHTEEP
jgi:hypothetical protein